MLYHFEGYSAFNGSGMPSIHKAYLCVDLFFVLSGFILALSYGERFNKNASWENYGAFLKARIARVYPAYFVITFLYYAKWVLNVSGTNKEAFRLQDVIANGLLVQGWGFPVRWIVSDGWSVSVELFAYLIFPILLVIAIGRNSAAAVALVAASMTVLIFVGHTGHGASGPLDVVQSNNSVLPLLRCLADFSLGLVMFRLACAPSWQGFLSSEYTISFVLILLCASLFVDQTDVFTVSVISLLIGCLYYNGKIGVALFGNGIIHHLGKISYSLYLLHPFFIGVAGHYKDVAAARFGLSAPLTFIVLGITATWVASYLSYRFIEVPARRYVHKRDR